MTEFGMKLATVVVAFDKQTRAASKKADRDARAFFNKELIRRDAERRAYQVAQRKQEVVQHRADVYGVPVEWLSL